MSANAYCDRIADDGSNPPAFPRSTGKGSQIPRKGAETTEQKTLKAESIYALQCTFTPVTDMWTLNA
ncbi:hypothetical protein Y032_0369g82 [Ancylostoma ceylanicum]|uniref:Uncharacterized protein n=1 Tax=Ancylostoma ceylanicum TaxID=53326 RepID=A0A016RUF4_9BILA|nr:hypothetical protein Y032_0369g82 [Ancylostoma ceylanicum]